MVGQIVTRSALNPTSLLPSTLQPTPMHRALPPPRTNLHVQVPSHTPSTSPTPCTQPYRHYLYCTAGGEKVQIWGARLVGIRGKTATFWRQIGGQHVPEKCARATYFQLIGGTTADVRETRTPMSERHERRAATRGQ